MELASSDSPETSLQYNNNNNNNCRGEKELASTTFRCAEKRYKLYRNDRRMERRRNLPETDFTDVVDFRSIEKNTEKNRSLIREVRCMEDFNIKCFTFTGVPGLLIFPGIISPEEQRELCRDAVLTYGNSHLHPNHLSTHASEPKETKRYEPPMRWATLGFSYHWSTKSYSKDSFSSFPRKLKERFEKIMRFCSSNNNNNNKTSQNENSEKNNYEPQTAIINYFPVGSMMMAHQDISEEFLQQPLISLSLGCSCIFLMGTASREEEPYAFWLRSGDVAVFSGPARLAFHAIPRILDDCPPEIYTICDKDDKNEEELYWREQMRHMRININVRQVYSDSCEFLFI